MLTERERSDICLSYNTDIVNERHVSRGARFARAYKIIRLPDLIRRLFQPSLRSIDPSIALIDVLLHIPHVVIFEAEFTFVGVTFVFSLQWLTMDFRTGAKILFCVGEEIVGTGADEE